MDGAAHQAWLCLGIVGVESYPARCCHATLNNGSPRGTLIDWSLHIPPLTYMHNSLLCVSMRCALYYWVWSQHYHQVNKLWHVHWLTHQTPVCIVHLQGHALNALLVAMTHEGTSAASFCATVNNICLLQTRQRWHFIQYRTLGLQGLGPWPPIIDRYLYTLHMMKGVAGWLQTSIAQAYGMTTAICTGVASVIVGTLVR